jgi:hypothetical protein
MEYMLIYHESESDFRKREDPQEGAAYFGAWMAYVGAMHGSGIVKSGAGLQPPHTATTVRLRDGKRLVQDGPFADTREQLGGYFVIEVPSLDVALEWAARAPCAATGGTEVRPVLPPMPTTASK